MKETKKLVKIPASPTKFVQKRFKSVHCRESNWQLWQVLYAFNDPFDCSEPVASLPLLHCEVGSPPVSSAGSCGFIDSPTHRCGFCKVFFLDRGGLKRTFHPQTPDGIHWFAGVKEL